MIPLQRVELSTRAQGLLATWTANVETAGGTTAAAREHWTRAKAAKNHVRTALEGMARGAARCMYCDDSRATDIDHFQPLDNAPHRAFVWLNHLLACSWCNSNEKREQYPVDATGACLLVDPTTEDPADHLELLLGSGEYTAVDGSPKGEATISVFGLNRHDLVRGRQAAFRRACSNLRDWHNLVEEDDPEADELAQALQDSPFIDVVHAMTRLDPGLAPKIVGQRTVPALDAWRTAFGI